MDILEMTDLEIYEVGIKELTDIEIYELGLKILADKLHVCGYVGFLQQHFKHLNNNQPIDSPQQSAPHGDVNSVV